MSVAMVAMVCHALRTLFARLYNALLSATRGHSRGSWNCVTGRALESATVNGPASCPSTVLTGILARQRADQT